MALNMNATLESVMALFEEVAERQKETAEQMRETDKKFQETDRKFQDVAEELKKTERLVDKLSKHLGGLGNDIGDFAEGLLTSDLLKKFAVLELDFDTTLRNVEVNERGTKRPLAELDCLLLGADIAMVIEVKTSMTVGDVDKHLNRMKKLSTKDNRLLSGKKLYGAMAGIKTGDNTKKYARRKGLFVLQPTGDTVLIDPPVGTPAVW
jgi:hypothetical protein